MNQKQLRAERDAALHAARAALADSTRLSQLLTTLGEPGSVESLLDRTVETLSELFEADVVALFTPAEPGTCTMPASIGIPEALQHDPWSTADDGPLGQALREAQAVLIESITTQTEVDPRLGQMGVQSAMWVPVHDAQATVVGVVLLGRCGSSGLSSNDVRLLSVMATRIGLAVEQAQHAWQLQHVATFAQTIGRYLDEKTIVRETVDILPSVLRADAATLFLTDVTGAIRASAHCGLTDAEIEAWTERSDSLVSRIVLSTGRPFHTSDVRLVSADRYPWSDVLRVRSVVAVPIMWDKRVAGALCVYRFLTCGFTADTVQLASLLAGQVAAALENARLYHAVRSSEDRLRALIRGVSDVIMIVAGNGTIRYVSPASSTAWGRSAEHFIGHNVLEPIHPDDVGAARDLFVRARAERGVTVAGGVRIRHSTQGWRDFELIISNQLTDLAVSGLVATFHDVTERKAFEQQLSQLAFRDELSGLPNRTLFMDRLGHALQRANREQTQVALLFVDLDNFKLINDSLGHAAGDAVLVEVAERIQSCLRAEDTAARLGGDEFTVLIEDAHDASSAVAVAERIGAALATPIALPRQDVFAAASIGIALSTPRGDNAEDLLRKADLAMYRAKTGGKSRFALFDASLNAVAQERLTLETDLRHAIERGELRVFYQPVVSLVDDRVEGVEALARWAHPRRGLLLPTDFVPIAEETGLVVPLGQWVLEEACRQVREWQQLRGDLPLLTLSVNLSARQFQHPTLVEDVARALEQSGLPPRCLTLEITETAVMIDADDAVRKLEELKAMNVRLAIDDFGTGYSSLSYLTRFPVDTLKIDRTFVSGIEHDPHNLAIVRSVIALADGLELSVTGEGIETVAQKAVLRALGCKRGQGHLFAPPLAADQACDVLLREVTTDEVAA